MVGHNKSDDTRVVITGAGVVCTTGEDLAQFSDSLRDGRSGITTWKRLGERIDCKIGGDMSDFDLRSYLGRMAGRCPRAVLDRALKLLRSAPLATQLTTATALQAFSNAGLPCADVPPERFAHVLAGHNLGYMYQYENVLTFLDEPDFIDPLYGMMVLDTDTLSVISELLSVKGASFTIGGACASSNAALIAALDMLRAGRADRVLVSGAAPGLDPVLLQGWTIMEAVVVRSFADEPQRASRPWDVRREGFVPSHGSGVVVLETLARARARGAPIYAELLGGACASDASRLPKPVPDGEVRAMRGALEDAGIAPEQVSYINAHATSTLLGDIVEVEAIKEVFGEHAYRVPINGTKSMIGHCLTAAGLVELVAVLAQMQGGFVHPTINLDEPDAGFDLDFVPNQARAYHIDVALSNSFGFGGLNTSIVVGRVAI